MSDLPQWDDMTDLDKGAALMHAWKVDCEGVDYATSDYPCEYFDDARLCALHEADASRHARLVAGSWDEVGDRIGWDEVERLYETAVRADGERVRAALAERVRVYKEQSDASE